MIRWDVEDEACACRHDDAMLCVWDCMRPKDKGAHDSRSAASKQLIRMDVYAAQRRQACIIGIVPVPGTSLSIKVD